MAKKWSAAVWESIAPALDGFGSLDYVRGALEGALAAGTDHGEATASFLLHLSGGAFAVADGRADYIKICARPVFESFMKREDEVKTIVRTRGAELERAGYHAQLEPGGDSGIFLLEDGRRKKVARDASARLEAAVREHIEQCSPGVILRNLVQDYVFRPLAVVLGPAELAYRAQVAPLYPFFGIGAPVPVPRMAATFIPPPVVEALERSRLACEEFIDSPARLADAAAGSMLGPRMEEARERANQAIDENLRRYLEEASRVLPEAEASRYRAQVEEGRRRLEQSLSRITQAGKQAASRAWPWLASVEAIIAPQGIPQERIVSLIVPFLFAGRAASDELAQLGARYVSDLLDGKPAHYVYSLY
ncbi:MAG: bacillithiol biosynthesis BshC [candidate division NC10 bacterium]|nr:bacillithiol biosynthesis BshC [candidate division NC10 bacterium]